jgi:putative addiction module component (TIGR02574 family)
MAGKDEALALSEEDRGKLAEKLVESLDGAVEPTADEAWAAEIQRRLARIEAGQAKSISMSEAVARMHRAAHGR